MINITNIKETQDNLEIPTIKTTQETCEVKEFSEPENIHQNLELPKFMETKVEFPKTSSEENLKKDKINI